MKLIIVIVSLLMLLCIIILVYLLVSPIKFLLDSRKGFLILGWNHWLQAKIFVVQNHWGAQVKLPFWQKDYPLSELFIARIIDKNKKRTKRTKRPNIRLAKVTSALKKIKIKEFKINVDTDNFILNAYLTPIFQLFGHRTGLNTHINFMGENEVKIKAESRIILVLLAFLL